MSPCTHAGLRSLWTMPLEWRWCMPRAMERTRGSSRAGSHCCGAEWCKIASKVPLHMRSKQNKFIEWMKICRI